MIEYLQNIKGSLFFLTLVIHYVLLIGVVWSLAIPSKRIWPPSKKNSWEYVLTWVLFYLAFILNGTFIFLDWNSWLFTDNFRFLLGIPITIIVTLLVSWGISSLGTKNTSGVKDGFISKGPYKFMRNPQYFGDMLLFLGIFFISNSLYVMIVNMLLILIFTIAPLAEEFWLEESYGELYIEYKSRTPRFL